MERIVLACGGSAVNSVEELSEADLGYADEVYEVTLGEEKYTFIEGVKNPRSCTILIKGPNEHTIAMIKDGVRDGLRAVKNVYDDKAVVPGAGSFEIACNQHLTEYGKSVEGKAKLGIQSFAESLLVIPKVSNFLMVDSGWKQRIWHSRSHHHIARWVSQEQSCCRIERSNFGHHFPNEITNIR